MTKTAIFVMMLTLVSKILGFGREVVLSYVYGASAVTDAFLISNTIPNVVFSIVGAGLSTGFVPIYSHILNESGKEDANKFTANLVNTLLVAITLIVVVVLVFTEPLVKIFASGFSDGTMRLTVRFTRITVFGIYFTTLVGIFSGLLRLYERFFLPALVSLPMNIILIGTLLLSAHTNVYVLALGSVLATAAQLVFLAPAIKGTGYQHGYGIKPSDVHIKSMFFLALPLLLGASVDEVNVLIDRTMASGLAEGGVSALNYAYKLNTFVKGLFASSIVSVFYPTVAKMVAEGSKDSIKNQVSETISVIALFVVPCTIGALVFSEEIVMFLFGRGAFSSEAVAMTSQALFFYSLGMLAVAAGEVLSRTCYALQDTMTPTLCAMASVFVNIVLNAILSRYLGLGGLALASSIAGSFRAVLLGIALGRKIGGFGIRRIAVSLMKIGIVSVVMGVASLTSFRMMTDHFGTNLSLIAAIIMGASVYLVLIRFARVPEVDSAIERIRMRIGARV